MKRVYPITLTKETNGSYTVYVPDFEINTQGEDLADALFMARDAIALTGCAYEDNGRPLPEASLLGDLKAGPEEIKTLVDVDFTEYRRRHERKTIRKNVTIPSWLNVEAERAGINFSATLQEALKEQLGYEK